MQYVCPVLSIDKSRCAGAGYKPSLFFMYSPSLDGLVSEVRVHRGGAVAHETREVVSAPRLSCLHHQRRLKERRKLHTIHITHIQYIRNTHAIRGRKNKNRQRTIADTTKQKVKKTCFVERV